MSNLDRFKPGLSVVFVRYDEAKYAGAWEALCRHLVSLDLLRKTAVVVDNADEALPERRLNDWAVEIGGDNRGWEFSAFDRGVEWLRSRDELCDLTLLVTDAFRAYGDGYLALVDRSLLQFCRREGAATGWVDSFLEPCRLLDVDYEAWFRTSYLILPTKEIARLRPFAWPLPEERIFGSSSTEPWRSDAPLSTNLRARLEDWLLARESSTEPRQEAGPTWHSRFNLDERALGFFRSKVKAILREHHLSTRVLEAGVPAYDIRVLSDLIVREREPAADGSDSFLRGLQTWLSRDRADEASGSRGSSQAEPRLIFAGDLTDPSHLAAVRGFSSRVMPLVLQRHPGATFEVPVGEPPLAVAGLAGVNRTFLRAPEWVMDAWGSGVAAVVTVGSVAPAVAAARGAQRIDIRDLSRRRPPTAFARRCCEALERARERIGAETSLQAEARTGNRAMDSAPATFVTMPIRWRADYQAWLAECSDELRVRDEYERALVSDTHSFALSALCRSCERETVMHVDFDYGGDHESRRPNWRERLVCQECGLNSKMRGVLHVVEEIVVPRPNPRILVWEMQDEMETAAQRHFGGASCVSAGRELAAAGYGGLFDCILVLDMFERTADLHHAIGASLELLEPGGGVAFSASFRSDRERTRTQPDAEPGEVLRVFGWSMLDRFREAGFADVVAHFFWSPVFGYLGVEQVVFVARKADAVG